MKADTAAFTNLSWVIAGEGLLLLRHVAEAGTLTSAFLLRWGRRAKSELL